MLVDAELLRFEDGRWTASSDLADLAVPPSIQALLSARLDRLDGEERAVIEPASVIGLVFADRRGAGAGARDDPRTGHRAPARPHRKQLVRASTPTPTPTMPTRSDYRFDHVMIREAAYGGLLKRARATFHERFVDWAVRVNRERGRETEYEEILGYHLEQAHQYLTELGPLDDHGRELGDARGRAPRVRRAAGLRRAATCAPPRTSWVGRSRCCRKRLPTGSSCFRTWQRLSSRRATSRPPRPTWTRP